MLKRTVCVFGNSSSIIGWCMVFHSILWSQRRHFLQYSAQHYLLQNTRHLSALYVLLVLTHCLLFGHLLHSLLSSLKQLLAGNNKRNVTKAGLQKKILTFERGSMKTVRVQLCSRCFYTFLVFSCCCVVRFRKK